MSTDAPNPAIRQAVLATLAWLRSIRARDPDRQADVDRAYLNLDRVRHQELGVEENQPALEQTRVAPPTDSQKLYQNKSVSEAAVAFLKEARASVRTKDLVGGLIEGGHKFDSANPVSAIIPALRRRSTNYQDITETSRGTWCHAAYLTDQEKVAFEHKQRTARGMAQARARGVALGQPARLTPEIEAKMAELFASGMRVKQVAKKFGFAVATVRLRFKGSRLKELRKLGAGGSDDRPSLKVVGGTDGT